MSEITLITPPDIIYNQNFSIFLICPSESIKQALQEIIIDKEKNYNIYIFNGNNENETSISWLLNIHRIADICIINLDLLPTYLKNLESYLISFSNTYFLSQAENKIYTLISNNKIYDLTHLSNKIGDTFDLQEKK